jgi:hypothetical protein
MQLQDLIDENLKRAGETKRKKARYEYLNTAKLLQSFAEAPVAPGYTPRRWEKLERLI